MHSLMLLLPILFPLAGGLVVSRIYALRVRRVVVAAILAAQLLLLLPLLWAGEVTAVLWELVPGVRIVLRCDGVSRLFTLLVCLLWLLVVLFSIEYMNHEGHRRRFFTFYLLTLGAMMGVCLAGNLVTLYLFFEMMTLCSVPLVLHIGTRKAFEAAWKYLAFSVSGAALGLLGLFFLQGYCATDLFTAGGVLNAALAGEDRQRLLAVFLLMAVGFGCKAGMFPLHVWLPVAHPVAPAPASAVLSALITKMGVVALIRVSYFLFGWEFLAGSWAQKVVLSLALVTILVGSTLALRQDNLKTRLAYSTVSQVSYVIFGLMLFTPGGLEGALFQAVFHAIAKTALFLAAGAIVYKTHLTQVSQMRGVGVVFPVSLWCFALAALSLIGIPPTGGFFSKWVLAQGALDAGLGWLGGVGVGVLMLSALLTAAYLLPVVTRGFFPGKDFVPAELTRQPDTWLMWGSLMTAAGLTLLLGLFPQWLSPAIRAVTAGLF